MSGVVSIGPVRPAARAWQRWGAAALCALAAGCASRAPAPPAARVAPPAPAATQAAPAPAIALRPGAPRNRVAVLVPTTGGSAAVGQSIANAAAMALADVGGQGFTLSTYNTAGPGGAAEAARQAVAGGAGLVLGPLLAGDVRAAAPVARAAGVPMLSFSNDAAVAGGGVYVLGFQPAQSVQRVVGFARARGVTRFAALIPGGVYGQRASTAFLRAVEAGGGRVTGIANYARDRRALVAAARRATDYDARVARAGGRVLVRPDGTVAPVQQAVAPPAAQALFIADAGSVAAAFAPPLAQFGARPGTMRLIGTELWAAEPGLARAPLFQGAWYAAVPDGRFRQLAARYAQRHGGRPSRLASLGYDAVLLAHAVSPDWALGARFPAARLEDAGGYSGIDGAFRLPPSGVAQRALEVRQIGPGGAAVVSPAPASFGPPRVSLLD